MQSRSSSPKALVNVGIIMLVIGLVMGIIAGVMIYNYNKKKQTYIQTTGVVVDYDRHTEYEFEDDPHSKYYVYAPIVEFEVDGKKYKAKYNTYMESPPKLGAEMSLRYNKNDPTDVVFDKDQNRIAIPIIAGVFIVFGFIFLVSGKVKSKKESEVW